MALSIASQTHPSSWRQIARTIVSGDPLEVLDKLDAAWTLAEREDDHVSQAALSSNAMAHMLVDWSRFTGWRGWIARFEAAEAALVTNPNLDADADMSLVRATGVVACALLRGDDNDALGPHGERLESLLNSPAEFTQLALAAGALLPWLQMSKNPAAAQVLHGRMIAPGERLLESPGTQYLRGAWLGSWALHMHFTDQKARLIEALAAFDHHLATVPSPYLQFRRARLAAEQALKAQNAQAMELGLRNMLGAIHAKRPMERVIYNMVAASFASAANDADRALLHVTHNLRDLQAADCPPSIGTVYRIAATRVHLTRGDYAQAAEIYEQCVQHAHTAHAVTYRGYAALARALLAQQQGTPSRELLREHLRIGLATTKSIPSPTFMAAVPVARAGICALALREGIEVEFVRAALLQSPVAPPAWADEHWPWAMSLRCFGGFRSVGLDADGRASSKASNRPLSLLMLIAANGSHGVPVASATDALWPDQDGDQAENSLSVTLLRLRRLYNETDLIERRNGWLHLNASKVWTDVVALEAHLDAMPETTVTEFRHTQYISRLFDLYRGNCLFGIDDDWAQSKRTHYRGRVTLAAQRLLQTSLESNHYAAAELTITQAFERGLDAPRLLNVVHAGQRSTPAWNQLQQHLKLLEAT